MVFLSASLLAHSSHRSPIVSNFEQDGSASHAEGSDVNIIDFELEDNPQPRVCLIYLWHMLPLLILISNPEKMLKTQAMPGSTVAI